MRNQKIYIAAFFLWTTLMACSHEVVPGSDGQTVYFEVGYSNWAWGRQIRGILIDQEGRVRVYNNPEKWNFPIEKKELTAAHMQENLSHTTLTDIRIDEKDLLAHISMGKGVSNSSLSDPESGGADRGATVYFTYRYNSDRAVYTPILLNQQGDWQIENRNPLAKILVSWLVKIRQQVK